VKEQKMEILTKQESRHSNRHNVFYFLPTVHPPVSGQLLTYIAHPDSIGTKAPQTHAETKALL
jgi:hypothetical protein